MNAIDDLELITSFRQGNAAAFNELVKRYHEKVYWIARRFILDHDQADEITQEVFIKVYTAISDFRFESNFYTWLYRVAVNLSINALRRKRVREFLRIDEFFDISDSATESPHALLEHKEQDELIQHAIDKLPEKQKAVFILRYHEEMPYEEISKILKTSVGGLKANYFHAVKNIGEYLNREHKPR